MAYERYPTRTAERNYFSIPNRIHTYRISPAAYAVYVYVRHNRKNDPRLERMAEELKISQVVAAKALEELVNQYLLMEFDGQYYLRWLCEEIGNCYLLPMRYFIWVCVWGRLLCTVSFCVARIERRTSAIPATVPSAMPLV